MRQIWPRLSTTPKIEEPSDVSRQDTAEDAPDLILGHAQTKGLHQDGEGLRELFEVDQSLALPKEGLDARRVHAQGLVAERQGLV